MKKPAPQAVHLKDYQPTAYLIDSVDLHFDLNDEFTVVRSTLNVIPNPKFIGVRETFLLNGEHLELLEIKLNGKILEKSAYEIDQDSLTLLKAPSAPFILESRVKIFPDKNTALEGLYKSSGMFCTQCEAEGFRRITYFQDRPDVMAKYSVSIAADKKLFPMLLSNGNLVSQKDLGAGRHEARWVDPFRKPCYLFALVAGDLGMVEDFFKTKSGRKVTLRIYVNKGNEHRCEHAMVSLKKSMKWDEERYGLEYDLDMFMIVAVDDFNAGAMENKGLNIFNANYVLANAATATDDDYNGIEGVVAHEYFHNWTGNRVTCRDWFQLSLKEGLTVYRDQEFTSDMTSRAVKRIDDVMGLRLVQFAEDAGPMAHPIRPDTYIEINNFYTPTVYEKGAEVIRMIATLIGVDKFRKGMDKYFELFDSQAVTTEDFVHAMELASGQDLSQFKRWYSQAGTPRIKVELDYQAAQQRCVLRISQSSTPSPGQPHKEPFHLPFAVGLLGSDGKEMASRVLAITKPTEDFVFESISAKPHLSLLRDFSAPVHVDYAYTDQELLFLLAHDQDAFARWEAGQKIALRAIAQLIEAQEKKQPMQLNPELATAFGKVLGDSKVDPAFRAQVLAIPSEEFISQEYKVIPIDEVHGARNFLIRAIAIQNEALFLKLYKEFHRETEKYEYSAEACGRRTLKNRALQYLCETGKSEYFQLAKAQMMGANNMTDELGALEALNDIACAERELCIDAFYKKWQHDSLVINKWFKLQAISDVPNGLDRVQKLMQDKLFTLGNPNKVRHLIFAFAYYNRVQFHHPSGDVYRFYTDQLLAIDEKNPQLASALMRVFNDWKRLDPQRQRLVQIELDRMMATGKLSPGVFEKVSKFLT